MGADMLLTCAHMKTASRFLLLALVSASLCNVTAFAARPMTSALDAGVRYHKDHSVFEALPFGDGDLSYSLGYEYHTKDYYLQLAGDYCPDVTGTNDVKFVATPEANVFITDGLWEAGVGILDSYISDNNDTNDKWTSVYWQLILGVTFPVYKIPVGLHVFYPFEKWGDINEFDIKDIEYGATLKYSF